MKALRVVALAAFSGSLFAQEAPQPVPEVGGDVEEVLVQGRTPLEVRLEIERVENAVYARFNELNSSDDFDILCSEHAPTGSNIPVRSCRPNFVLRAEQRSAGASLGRMQGDAYSTARNQSAHLQKQSEELSAEMQRVAREDPQLLRDLVRLAELKDLQPVDGQPPDEAPSAPASE